MASRLPSTFLRARIPLPQSIQSSAPQLLRQSPTLCPSLTSSQTAPSQLFSTATRRLVEAEPVAIPVKKPVGAFRGSIFGFLMGSTVSGAAVYYYILQEYKVSNELLTEDIYALQSALQRIESYVRKLEEAIDTKQKGKK